MASLKKRNGTYYAQWYVGNHQRRASLKTDSYQLAKERMRQIETRLAEGADDPLPSKTPIGTAIGAYVRHIRGRKTAKSAQTDVYYLRQMFGACCPELEITSRVVSAKSIKRPIRPGVSVGDAAPIETASLEQLTTAMLSDFIARMVRAKGLAPKTANRYREIANRLFNWSMREGGVRMPRDVNPAARLERYRERAPEIRYLTLPQVREQLDALESHRQLQTMVAVYIFAGLRREEALWLTMEDVDLRGGTHPMLRVRAKTVGDASWQPKTRVNRAVPISGDLLRYLVRYRPRPSTDGWFFPSPDGKRYDPDNFSADLRAAQTRAGLPWACLDFRHTFGSLLAQKGVSLYKIATLMGNSPEICRRHYTVLVPEAMVEEVVFTSALPKLSSSCD